MGYFFLIWGVLRLILLTKMSKMSKNWFLTCRSGNHVQQTSYINAGKTSLMTTKPIRHKTIRAHAVYGHPKHT